MTRKEGKEFANALKNNYTIDFDKLPEFCDLVISALSENKGDLISRQAVIDALTKTSGIRGDALKALYDLPSVENKGEWIPVSERLPKPYEQVLRTVKSIWWNGTSYIDVDLGTICPIDTNVIAWQPLPEPYKAESEEV